MSRVRDVLRSAAIWSGFAGVVAVAVPPMVLGYPLVLVDPYRALSDWYFRTLGKTLVKVNPLWKVRACGREKLERGGPFVLVVNHQSFADLIAMCFLDHPTKYLGKASVFDVPVFGWALRIAGEVPVVRGNRDSGPEALERIGAWLARGVSVALFPVVLSGARNLLPKGSLVFRGDADVRVRVLDPIATDGYTLDDAGRLAEEVRAKMVEAYG